MRLFILTIISIILLCSCGNTNKPDHDFFSKTDTTKHTLCVYQVNDTSYQIGYLTRVVRDTMMLARDTVKFSSDSSEFEMKGKKKWIKDTAYFIDLQVMDTVTKMPTVKQFPLNFNAVIADCGKDVEGILSARKLKPYVDKQLRK